MDNMRSYHIKRVREIIEKARMILLYLPPYSSNLNPIEEMWSKIKKILRKLKIHVLTELPDTLQSAFSFVTSKDCQGWFSSAGVFD